MQTKSPVEVEQAERVASIKADIDAGTYKVDAKKLASNIPKLLPYLKGAYKMSIEKILQSLNKLDMLHKSLLEVAYKKTEAIKTWGHGQSKPTAQGRAGTHSRYFTT